MLNSSIAAKPLFDSSAAGVRLIDKAINPIAEKQSQTGTGFSHRQTLSVKKKA
jgi:hypothetical protein